MVNPTDEELLAATAVSEKDGAERARRSSVVLPLPRNPVSNVTGRVSSAAVLVTPGPRDGSARSFHAPGLIGKSADPLTKESHP